MYKKGIISLFNSNLSTRNNSHIETLNKGKEKWLDLHKQLIETKN